MEKSEYPKVLHASAGEAGELAVIDVTHPAFALPFDEREIAARVERFYRGERVRGRIPKPIQRFVLSLLSRRSRLASALANARNGVVGGMTLYVVKLGPEQLSGIYGGTIDRKITESAPSWLARVRLEDMVQLEAENLAAELRAQPNRPLHFFNIAGGPGADSWNALLLIQKREPGVLANRPIAIHVLDPDEVGPAFGARAVAALSAAGAPLAGLDVRFDHQRYDWSHADQLSRVLADARVDEALVVVSSEGGLFEYGSDQEIIANLGAIRRGAPDGTVIVGSVTRAEAPAPFLRQFTVRPRTLEAFRHLAKSAGFRLDKTIERPLSYNVRLTRAR